MKFVSTRNGESVSLDTAISQGIASDGGLFVPGELPQFEVADFRDADSISAVARVLMAPFFRNSRLAGELGPILDETFAFPVTLKPLADGDRRLQLLELFHGPTAAFKDIGAGFLAACLGRLQAPDHRPLTILVATSGDTGGAVAAAFDGRRGMQVVILYPDGRVSARQAHQLTCWSDNVLSLAVQGSFDDCQSLVKSAMADNGLGATFRLSSANSINIGRLLPQCTYYAWASLAHYRSTGRKPGFIVPTGNLGNGLACLLARAMRLPIGDVLLSTNANRLVVDWLAGADWIPRAGRSTLASAMDVGNPSNMERLRNVFGERDALRESVDACSVGDDEIKAEIRRSHDAFGLALCPHTATAVHAWRQLPQERQRENDWIAVATAHAAKFEQIVEPIIGETIALPAALRDILSRPRRYVEIEASIPALTTAMMANLSLDAETAPGDK